MGESTNDYKILKLFLDNDCTTELKSKNLYEVKRNSGFSIKKMRGSIKTLISLQYLKEGVMKQNQDTYFISKVGVDKLQELYGGEISIPSYNE